MRYRKPRNGAIYEKTDTDEIYRWLDSRGLDDKLSRRSRDVDSAVDVFLSKKEGSGSADKSRSISAWFRRLRSCFSFDFVRSIPVQKLAAVLLSLVILFVMVPSMLPLLYGGFDSDVYIVFEPEEVYPGDLMNVSVSIPNFYNVTNVSVDMSGFDTLSLSFNDETQWFDVWESSWVIPNNVSEGRYVAWIYALDVNGSSYSAGKEWRVLEVLDNETEPLDNTSSPDGIDDGSSVDADDTFIPDFLNISVDVDKEYYRVDETVFVTGFVTFNDSLVDASVDLSVVGPGVDESISLNATLDGFSYEFVPIMVGSYRVQFVVFYKNMSVEEDLVVYVQGLPPQNVTDVNVTDLVVWDDTDYLDLYVDDNVTFYANCYRGGVGVEDATCLISFLVNSNWTTPVVMNYNGGVHVYTRSFDKSGSYEFNVSCFVPGYGNLSVASECVILKPELGVFEPLSQVEVGKPVLWSQSFYVEDGLMLNVSGFAYNISVVGVFSEDDVFVIDGNVSKGLRDYNTDKKKDVLADSISDLLTMVESDPDDVESQQEIHRLYSVLNDNVSFEESLNESYGAIEEYVSNFVSDGSDVQLFITNVSGEVEVSYLTSGPEVYEEPVEGDSKRVVVSSDVHYEDVFTYVSIVESPREHVRLYWLVDDSYELVLDVTYVDTNGNGLVDRLEWVTPSLSNQTYMIVITKAEHLDENRNFVSDIYDEVYRKDGVWSEPIYHDEYVRVTFIQNLTEKNDIKFYVRNTQGLNTSMEVFYFDSDEKIAESPVIVEEGYYKVFLEGLVGSQRVFDIRVKNLDSVGSAFLEFDHIVDPETFDLVDDNSSDMDSSADKGTESNFDNCKDSASPNNNNMTIQEIDQGAYVQVTYQAAGAGNAIIDSSLDVAYPASPALNDLFILHVMVLGVAEAPNTPTGWTLIYGPDTLIGDVARTWVFANFSLGSESGNLALGFDGASAVKMARIYMFRNVALTDYYESGGWDTADDDVLLDVGVTTSLDKGYALNLIGIRDDSNDPIPFTGETGGDWLQLEDEFETSLGDDGALDIQGATMATHGTIDGGSYDMGQADEWGIRGFGLKPLYVPKYVVDFEYNWTNANSSADNAEVCIYVNDTTGNENLNVKYWDGSWKSVGTGTITGTGWTNLTATGLTDATYEIQLVGASESSDTTQDSWDIDVILLHTWPHSYGTLNITWSASSDLDCTHTSGSPKGLSQGELFWMNVTIKADGSPGDIYGSVSVGARDNRSGGSTMDYINTTEGGTPFYVNGSSGNSEGILEGTWYKLNPAGNPPVQERFGMAYDSGSDHTIVYGGLVGDGDETWLYNYSNNTWYNANPSVVGGPMPALSDHNMVYDSVNDRTILFGGDPKSDPRWGCNDTWVYNFSDNTWYNMSPSYSNGVLYPSGAHGMAYDSDAERVIMFVGTKIIGGGYTWINYTWVYNFSDNTWYNMSPAVVGGSLPRVTYGELAYDSANKLTVMFGGLDETYLVGSESNETWVYNFSDNTWYNMSPDYLPHGRGAHCIDYDSNAERVVVFGGAHLLTGGILEQRNDTWVYNYTDNVWHNVSFSQVGENLWGHEAARMVYDSSARKHILFGGYDDKAPEGGNLNDTWVYNYTGADEGGGGGGTNPETLETLSYGDTRYVNFSINATGTGPWRLDVNVTSDNANVDDNETCTAYVVIGQLAPTQSNQKIWNSTTTTEWTLSETPTSVSLTPTSFNFTIYDPNDDDTMDITLRTNESGTWTTVNSSSGLSSGTYTNFTNTSWIDSSSTKYWVSFNLTDGTDWSNETFSFTTAAGVGNNEPTQSNQKIWNSTTTTETALSGSPTGIDLTPTSFNVTISDSDVEDTMDITLRTNESGTWTNINESTSLSSGTYSFTNTSWVDSYSTKYWVSFNLTDGTDWSNETFSFTTESESEDTTITVTPETWSQGDLDLGTSNATTGNYFTITNDGTVAVNISIKASNATNATSVEKWQLDATPDYNKFSLQYNKSGDASWTTITYSYSTFINYLAQETSETFDLKIFMATTSITTEPLSVTVTFKSVSA